MKLKKGDRVRFTTGEWRGKTGILGSRGTWYGRTAYAVNDIDDRASCVCYEWQIEKVPEKNNEHE